MYTSDEMIDEIRRLENERARTLAVQEETMKHYRFSEKKYKEQIAILQEEMEGLRNLEDRILYEHGAIFKIWNYHSDTSCRIIRLKDTAKIVGHCTNNAVCPISNADVTLVHAHPSQLVTKVAVMGYETFDLLSDAVANPDLGLTLLCTSDGEVIQEDSPSELIYKDEFKESPMDELLKAAEELSIDLREGGC